MYKQPTRCEWCRRILSKNGDMSSNGQTINGIRWYKTKRGYCHPGRCNELQMKRENSEPVFRAPLRLVPP